MGTAEPAERARGRPRSRSRMTAEADGAELSQRLSKIETAISRRKTIEFTYYTIERDATEKRKVNPYHLVYRGGQFYLIGHSHERDDVRVFRLSRIRARSPTPPRPSTTSARPRTSTAATTPAAPSGSSARPWQGEDLPSRADRLAGRARLRLLRRDPAARRPRRRPGQGQRVRDRLRDPPLLAAWVMRWRQHAQCSSPPSSPTRSPSASTLLRERHSGEFETADAKRGTRRQAPAAAPRTPVDRVRRSARSASPGWSPSPGC